MTTSQTPSTSIMATVADVRCTPEFLRPLFALGATEVRINSAHVDAQGLARMVATLRDVNPCVAILTDTKGPEIRTTAFCPAVGGGQIIVGEGDEFAVASASTDLLTGPGLIVVNYEGIEQSLAQGQTLMVDDGAIAMIVTARRDGEGRPVVRALNGGILGERKSVAAPGLDIDRLPAASERDTASLREAARLGIDMVAHSFVRSAADVKAVRAILDEAGGEDVKLFAKIECRQGVKNFRSILEAADGILIARGDLGMELEPELIPSLQRELTRLTLEAGKPVIVATQFLQSMTEHPRPTRAEMTDIETAVRQGATTLLLCGETAAGRYPHEAVAAMQRAIAASFFNPLTLIDGNSN